MGLSWCKVLGKESVHGLERNTLGLWHEEEDEDDGADHKSGKEEEETVTHSGEGLWGEPGNNEVPEPVGGSCCGLTKSTDVLAVHLGVVDPWGTVP